MAKSPTETKISMPSSGRWDWNDETQSLEFISYATSVEVNEKTKKKNTPTYQEHLRKHLEKWQKNTVGPAQLDAFKASIKCSQKECVTIQDVILAAVSLLQENEALPIPLHFLSLLKSQELEKFLASLLLYFSCYFERKALEERPKSLMASRGLSTYSEIQLNECLYSFCTYAVWVTFERRDLKGIQVEIGRLFRSDTFNVARRTQVEESEEEQEDQDHRKPALNDRKSKRRPGLNSIITHRSPLIVSLLPTPRENAPHLFGSFRHLQQRSTEHSDSKALMEELNQHLATLCFGILGKPLSQFSSMTLNPQGGQSEAEKDDDEQDGKNSTIVNDDPHVHIRSSKTDQRSMTTTTDKRSNLSRVDLVSRATTEGVYSDTE
ncbi:protein phosphatase 1 regulatory subunit 36 isoform X2 [Xyrauchen texanus]|uniref:protein phosphatase 1 regulatory subunit 36 isoform X2 n=1 Tax=Xyrauchen texanus TaxID=154827 RepID=UPI002242945A|nr:protein phosphatase 1 regulatory subunit 36 isoform X2 [Xyrauchen texanus]